MDNQHIFIVGGNGVAGPVRTPRQDQWVAGCPCIDDGILIVQLAVPIFHAYGHACYTERVALAELAAYCEAIEDYLDRHPTLFGGYERLGNRLTRKGEHRDLHRAIGRGNGVDDALLYCTPSVGANATSTGVVPMEREWTVLSVLSLEKCPPNSSLNSVP